MKAEHLQQWPMEAWKADEEEATAEETGMRETTETVKVTVT